MTLGNTNNEPIIQVRNISKKYNIGMDKTYKTFSESFTNAIRHPIKSLQSIGYQHDTFWALKNINFEVEQGEVVGIIGRNGAGKSTLLKILSRITTPTEGEIRLKGRVGSLLEVGTGFHPELTGRENIYFNGAILGMKKKEIDDKFDEIVKFSGVEKFLDTPVKRYSSGMNVRLAFSVAANLDPEILIVDEVLAVGDAAFQKKCLGKMKEVSEGGRTVLFVSHNMGAIRKLCSRTILLENGNVINDHETNLVINQYLNRSEKEFYSIIKLTSDEKNPLGNGLYFKTLNSLYQPQSIFKIGEKWYLDFSFYIHKEISHVIAAVGITTIDSIAIATYYSKPKDLTPGKYRVLFQFNHPIKANTLQFTIGLSECERTFYYKQNIGLVQISDVSIGKQPIRSSGGGLLLTDQNVDIEKIPKGNDCIDF